MGQVALEPPEFSWVGETQRQVGTIVHGYLARIAAGTLAPGAEAIAAEHAAVLAQLARHGVPAAERAAAAALILRALTQSVADERGRWILDPAHRAAQGELALSGLSAGRLRTFVIDRTFIDAAGTRWAIDYKTSRHEGGGVEAFLDSEVERYRAQLAGYVELLAGLGPEPVRAGLYFPLLGAFREVPGLGRLEGSGERELPPPGVVGAAEEAQVVGKFRRRPGARCHGPLHLEAPLARQAQRALHRQGAVQVLDDTGRLRLAWARS